MFSSLDISASALVAQRVRMEAIASNIANMLTTHNEAGERIPYQARYVVFKADDQIASPEGGVGVKVDSVQISQKPPDWRYQPTNPERMLDGPHKDCVAYPNIDMTTEFVDSLTATRAYEANVGVMEASKSMFAQALRIIG